jgi:hypothetical protein
MCFDCNAFQYQLNQDSHPKDHVFQVRRAAHKSPEASDELTSFLHRPFS